MISRLSWNSLCDSALTGTDPQNSSSEIMLSKKTSNPFGVSRI